MRIVKGYLFADHMAAVFDKDFIFMSCFRQYVFSVQLQFVPFRRRLEMEVLDLKKKIFTYLFTCLFDEGKKKKKRRKAWSWIVSSCFHYVVRYCIVVLLCTYKPEV